MTRSIDIQLSPTSPSDVEAGRKRFFTACALAAALGLAACGGQDSTIETSEIEVGEAPTPTDAVDPLASDTLDQGADALEQGADAVAAAGADVWTELQGDWESSVGMVQAHFGALSEEEILATGGDRQQLVAVVQERYQLEPNEAEQQVADWEATL